MRAPIRSILVPVDGSEGSRDALEAALGLAESSDAKVFVLEVIEDFGPLPGHYEAAPDGIERVPWLAEQRFSQPSQQICLDEYVEAVRQASARVQRLEDQVRELVSVWSLGPVVSAMTAHRGVSLVVAATVCAELGDLTRFDRVRQLMGFVGLVPSLHATGLRHRAGAITKTGNAHVRRVLVEAAWSYRHPARRTAHIRRSLEGLPEEIQAISWKAQVRLCGRRRRMIARGKHPNKVTVAIARELLAFLWATARMVKPMIPAV